MKKLSIIIPVYNEEATIGPLLNKVRRAEIGEIEKEIIVVCDGSTDGTRPYLKKEASKPGSDLKVIYHERNQGKGKAVVNGLEVASGDLVLVQDADLELNPDDYGRLLNPLLTGGANVVFGSRFRSAPVKIHFLSRWANRIVTNLSNVLYDARLSDEACGYKVMKTEIMRDLKLACNGFDFCPEVTAKVRKRGYPITEVPVQFYPRGYQEGKKIHWKDGFRAVWTLLRLRFSK